MADLQTVQLFLASVASAAAAKKTWFELRDRKKAKQAAELAREEVLSTSDISIRARKILSAVPGRTLERLIARYEKCYKRFDEMMDNEDDYFEDAVDNAAENALPDCVCRALLTLKNVAGDLSNEPLNEVWDQYDCKSRLAKLYSE